MSGYLWKAYLEDDATTFRAVLETSGIAPRGGGHGGARSGSQQTGGNAPSQQLSHGFGAPELDILASPPEGLAFSPRHASRRKASHHDVWTPPANLVLSRSDLNHRDAQGRTLLHLAASSALPSALEFANALLEHPLTDIYMQDRESGWTALHRAFYAGNLSVALAIMARDAKMDGHSGPTPGGLIRIKDSEGNGPFDLLEQALSPLDIFHDEHSPYFSPRRRIDDEDDDSSDDERTVKRRPGVEYSLQGEEVFTFGSNKNINLGFGDEDDRQFPERITLKRPNHLIQRLVNEAYQNNENDVDVAISMAPFMVRNKPFQIQSVIMGRYSTAVITDDNSSNLYICGHGSGGRLGLGDEQARFQFACVDTGTFREKKIRDGALGDHHTLAVTESGQVFSWGTNTWGQLGYDLPENAASISGRSTKDSAFKATPKQLSPRQIFGPIKREEVCGVAASGIHSVLTTSTSLYTFGKNEGQLGHVNADARWPAFQSNPKRVPRDFQAAITAVAAIDRATVCLLKNFEVWVFANYGYTKLNISDMGIEDVLSSQLRGHLSQYTIPQGAKGPADPGKLLVSRHHRVAQVAANGDTICLRTVEGDVFSLTVGKAVTGSQDGSVSGSTTNPSKIRGSLSTPICIWSNRKIPLAAAHVDVDQSGAVILTTCVGSVWKRMPRAKIATLAPKVGTRPPGQQREYKFSRIPGLTSIVAVKASGFGAYSAVRRERESLMSKMRKSADYKRSLEPALFKISAFRDMQKAEHPLDIVRSKIRDGICSPQKDVLLHFQKHLQKGRWQADEGLSPPDVWLGTTTSNLIVPTHRFLLALTSPVFRELFDALERGDAVPGPNQRHEFVVLEKDDRIALVFRDYDVMTLVNLAVFIISGAIPSSVSWATACVDLAAAPQELNAHARNMKTQLLRLASRHQMLDLEVAVRADLDTVVVSPLRRFFQSRAVSAEQLPGTDIVITLEDDEEMRIHSALMVQRSPFFNGLFWGRSGGMWVADRREAGEAVKVDLSHVSKRAFEHVVRWAYSDSPSLFDTLIAEDTNDYLEQILEVLDIANELLMKPLSHLCQIALCNQINVRNVCYVLTAVSQSNVPYLKETGLQYICLNLEAVLRHGHIEELEEDLLTDLDRVAKTIQENASPGIKKYLSLFTARNPDLAARGEHERQTKIDSILLLNKYSESYSKSHPASSFRAGSFLEHPQTPSHVKPRRRNSNQGSIGSPSPSSTPILEGKAPDLMFDMDDEEKDFTLSSPALDRGKDMSENIGHFSPEKGKRASFAEIPNANTPSRPSLRDIMAEDALSDPIVSTSLSKSASDMDRKPLASFATTKVSQKERKRQLQQMQLQSTMEVPKPPPLIPAVSAFKASPWKTIAKPKSSIINEPPGSPPAASRTGVARSAPHLTMRQTVANPGSAPKGKATSQSIPPQVPSSSTNTPRKASAEASQTRAQPPTTPRRPSSSSTSSTPIQIQSIRHTPLPSRQFSSAGQSSTSMFEIQSQQAAEKERIMGGGEKRSLAEIQAEQEFQEWWEKESARVQNEERERNRQTTGRDGRKAPGRGRRKRKSGGGEVVGSSDKPKG